VPEEQLKHYKPIVILVNERNEIVSKFNEKIFA